MMNRRIRENTGLIKQQPLFICLLLVLVTVWLYLPVGDFDYFYYDDPAYVTRNPNVREGLTARSVLWAFLTRDARNWHPLTWLSHMADVELYGLHPGAHHLSNVIFHVVNSLLVFVVFRKMTGAMWRSAFAAALFAVHPLHVESVAWIAERKNVLSTFFWMLTLLAYAGYAGRPGVVRYSLVFLFFILGFMAKPMVVTLPFVLMLLDFWPLGRFSFKGAAHQPASGTGHLNRRLIYEKAPLLVLSALMCVITVAVQAQGGAIRSLDQFPLFGRVANALSAYVGYIGKLMWPDRLAVFYPYAHQIVFWQITGALLLLTAISVVAVKYAGRYPYLVVGWFWFIGTLIPLIGLVQVGVQAMADRYAYIPSLGLFIAFSWGGADLAAKRRLNPALKTAVALSVVALLVWVTGQQIGRWRDSKTLFLHTLRVTEDNYVIHLSLGDLMAQEGRLDDAVAHYQRALGIKPDLAEAHNNLGVALGRKNDFSRAIDHYREAVRIRPHYAEAERNLGTVLLQTGRSGEAANHYVRSLLFDADAAATHHGLGLALVRRGTVDRAVHHFREACRLEPLSAAWQRSLNLAVSLQTDLDRSLDALERTLREDPNAADSENYIHAVEKRKKDLDAVVQQYLKALTLQQGFIPAEFTIDNYHRASEILKIYGRALASYMPKKAEN